MTVQNIKGFNAYIETLVFNFYVWLYSKYEQLSTPPIYSSQINDQSIENNFKNKTSCPRSSNQSYRFQFKFISPFYS